MVDVVVRDSWRFPQIPFFYLKIIKYCTLEIIEHTICGNERNMVVYTLKQEQRHASKRETIQKETESKGSEFSSC